MIRLRLPCAAASALSALIYFLGPVPVLMLLLTGITGTCILIVRAARRTGFSLVPCAPGP